MDGLVHILFNAKAKHIVDSQLEDGVKLSLIGCLHIIFCGFLIILRHDIACAIVVTQMIESVGIALLGFLLPMGEIFIQILGSQDVDAFLLQDFGCIWKGIDNGLELRRTDDVGLRHM